MTDSAKRGTWIRTTVVALVIAAAGIALLVRTPASIGHWDDAAGRDRFRAAYDTAFAALPTPSRTLDIRTDYGLVRVYRFTGARPAARPFVLLPGRASATPVWADNLPGLLELGDVYTVDLLGEPGLSIQERPIESDADQAAWLHQALAALPEEAVHLVGLSIGGWTAVNLALHDPAHIATLTLIDPVHVFDDLPLGTIVRSLPAAMPWLPKSWRDGFNSYTAGGAPVEDEPIGAMIEAGMQHYRLKLPAPSRIPEDRLTALRPPVLAIIAGRSVMHDPATTTATARRALPAATLRVYPDASHAVNGEHPDRLAADIAAFTGANP